MASVRMELHGLDELNAALSRHNEQLARSTEEAHRKLAEVQAQHIRSNAPRPPGASGQGTGALAARVRARRLTRFQYEVVVGEEGVTPYLGHYEFGTRHQPARPFVRRGVAIAESTHTATMLATVRRWLR